jgi:acyl carrier protein
MEYQVGSAVTGERSELARNVCGIIDVAARLPAGAVRPETSMLEIGIDSLGVAVIAAEIQWALDLDLSDEQLAKVHRALVVQDILDAIRQDTA